MSTCVTERNRSRHQTSGQADDPLSEMYCNLSHLIGSARQVLSSGNARDIVSNKVMHPTPRPSTIREMLQPCIACYQHMTAVSYCRWKDYNAMVILDGVVSITAQVFSSEADSLSSSFWIDFGPKHFAPEKLRSSQSCISVFQAHPRGRTAIMLSD